MRISPRLVTGGLVLAALVIVLLQKGPEAPQTFTPRGPIVGERLPTFELADQKGVVKTFELLRGPRGLVLVFFQSADW